MSVWILRSCVGFDCAMLVFVKVRRYGCLLFVMLCVLVFGEVGGSTSMMEELGVFVEGGVGWGVVGNTSMGG